MKQNLSNKELSPFTKVGSIKSKANPALEIHHFGLSKMYVFLYRGLKQMENEMTLIGSDEQRALFGGDDNDCFWQCVAYVNNDPNVDALVLDYYVNALGYTESDADAYLSSSGASVQPVDIPSYYEYLGCDYDPDFSDGKYIVTFNNNDVDAYESIGGTHAVVITSENPDGTLNYFDPQGGVRGIFSLSDKEKLTYAGY